MGNLLGHLTPMKKRILELAMQNMDVHEIAHEINRSTRTVRRTLQSIREEMEHRLLRSVNSVDSATPTKTSANE